jgi:hypothetical protein
VNYTRSLLIALLLSSPLLIGSLPANAYEAMSGTNCIATGSLPERWMQRGAYGIRNVDNQSRPWWVYCPVTSDWDNELYEIEYGVRLANDSNNVLEYTCILTETNSDGEVQAKYVQSLDLGPNQRKQIEWGDTDSEIGSVMNINCKLPARGRIISYGLF